MERFPPRVCTRDGCQTHAKCPAGWGARLRNGCYGFSQCSGRQRPSPTPLGGTRGHRPTGSSLLEPWAFLVAGQGNGGTGNSVGARAPIIRGHEVTGLIYAYYEGKVQQRGGGAQDSLGHEGDGVHLIRSLPREGRGGGQCQVGTATPVFYAFSTVGHSPGTTRQPLAGAPALGPSRSPRRRHDRGSL